MVEGGEGRAGGFWNKGNILVLDFNTDYSSVFHTVKVHPAMQFSIITIQ